MSGPFDPIEDWLGADVELLPPRPGAFERVHRRARRRKATMAMSAAAGVAAVVVAAAVLPHVASGLLPGGGDGQANVRGASPSHRVSPQPSGSHKGRQSPGPTPSGKAYLPGPGLAIGDSASPAAPGFRPTSITFYNFSAGAALGTTTAGCQARACTTVAGTGNYGKTWTLADAPPAGPPDGNSGVSQLRFLNPAHGWAFGPELFATADGGTTWTRVTGLPGRVIDLATVSGTAYAVVASCSGTGADFAAGCSSFALYSFDGGAGGWAPVPGAKGSFPVSPGGLQLTQASGYLLAGPALFTGSPAGGPWQRVSVTSATVPACLDAKGHTADGGASGVLAPDPSGLVYLLCQEDSGSKPVLYTSADSGQTWKLASHANVAGTATSMAVGTAGGTLVVATTSGLYYSPDAHTWHQASLDGQAPGGFSYVGMTDAVEGVAVPANPALKKIYITSDGGKTWQARPI